MIHCKNKNVNFTEKNCQKSCHLKTVFYAVTNCNRNDEAINETPQRSKHAVAHEKMILV